MEFMSLTRTNSRDKARYDAMRDIGCIACLIARNPTQCGKLTMHHIVDKGYRKHSGGNQATIPLGEWHHQGYPHSYPHMDYTAGWMRMMYGPSMALESKEFARIYGSQRELLGKVNEMLRVGKRL
jgi:Recombination enhancement, RecA-dependent nuclease